MAALLILLHCWLQDVYSANSTVFIARQHTVWCILYGVYFGCLLYADGIMLLSHSLSAMRCMLQICDDFATEYDIRFNTRLISQLLCALVFVIMLCVNHLYCLVTS